MKPGADGIIESGGKVASAAPVLVPANADIDGNFAFVAVPVPTNVNVNGNFASAAGLEDSFIILDIVAVLSSLNLLVMTLSFPTIAVVTTVRISQSQASRYSHRFLLVNLWVPSLGRDCDVNYSTL